MTITPPLPRWPMVATVCAWCHVFPCACPRTEPCACGGMIAAIDNEDAIRAAVVTHQHTDLHRVWRERRETL